MATELDRDQLEGICESQFPPEKRRRRPKRRAGQKEAGAPQEQVDRTVTAEEVEALWSDDLLNLIQSTADAFVEAALERVPWAPVPSFEEPAESADEEEPGVMGHDEVEQEDVLEGDGPAQEQAAPAPNLSRLMNTDIGAEEPTAEEPKTEPADAIVFDSPAEEPTPEPADAIVLDAPAEEPKTEPADAIVFDAPAQEPKTEPADAIVFDAPAEEPKTEPAGEPKATAAKNDAPVPFDFDALVLVTPSRTQGSIAAEASEAIFEAIVEETPVESPQEDRSKTIEEPPQLVREREGSDDAATRLAAHLNFDLNEEVETKAPVNASQVSDAMVFDAPVKQTAAAAATESAQEPTETPDAIVFDAPAKEPAETPDAIVFDAPAQEPAETPDAIVFDAPAQEPAETPDAIVFDAPAQEPAETPDAIVFDAPAQEPAETPDAIVFDAPAQEPAETPDAIVFDAPAQEPAETPDAIVFDAPAQEPAETPDAIVFDAPAQEPAETPDAIVFDAPAQEPAETTDAIVFDAPAQEPAETTDAIVFDAPAEEPAKAIPTPPASAEAAPLSAAEADAFGQLGIPVASPELERKIDQGFRDTTAVIERVDSRVQSVERRQEDLGESVITIRQDVRETRVDVAANTKATVESIAALRTLQGQMIATARVGAQARNGSASPGPALSGRTTWALGIAVVAVSWSIVFYLKTGDLKLALGGLVAANLLACVAMFRKS